MRLKNILQYFNDSDEALLSKSNTSEISDYAQEKTVKYFRNFKNIVAVKTDKLLVALLLFQWVFGLLLALAVLPESWLTKNYAEATYIWISIYIGAVIIGVPVYFGLKYSGEKITRNFLTTTIILCPILLIHLTGGGTATYFFLFGSMACLSFYKEWRVIILALAVVAIDYVLCLIFWPQSVLGLYAVAGLSWIDHTSVILLEAAFLIYVSIKSKHELFYKALSSAIIKDQLTTIKVKKSDLYESNRTLETASILFRKAQEGQEEINARLTKRSVELRERNKEIEESRNEIKKHVERLKLADKYKNEFLTNMSHELRTPLNSILILSQLLQKNNFKNLSDKDIEFATVIEKSGKNLLLLIEDVLDLAKIEAGKMKAKSAKLEIGNIVDYLSAEYKDSFDKLGIMFDCSLYEEINFSLESDEKLLQRILKYLVSNALKFTDIGGEVSVSISMLDNKEIKLLEDEKRGTPLNVIMFIVQDSGVGIANEDLNIIFDEFIQLDGTLTRKHGGTGLGLTLAEKLSAILGGEILVSSEEGKGSVFSLILPENFQKNLQHVSTKSLKNKTYIN
ncbi:MAG: hypothetical protein HRT71_08305 [Flavobacteriales bacterium]|nr:hypothetical protein [Flavobacteriales bacterium]